MQGASDGRQRADRVVGEMRIGDVALAAENRQPAGQRAAPAVLHRVAERLDAGRLAEDAMVETFAAARAHSSSLAVPLTAGPSSSPVTRKLIEPVDGALRRSAARRRAQRRRRPSCRRRRGPRLTVRDLAGERIEPPSRIARRHDVGMAGEDEIGPRRPEARVEIVESPASRAANVTSSTAKPAAASRSRKIGQRAASAGVTEGKRISARAISSAEGVHAPCLLVASLVPSTSYRGRISRTSAAQSSTTS